MIKVVIAMGYQDDGWTSSWLHAEQLQLALTRLAEAEHLPCEFQLHAPKLGRKPHVFDRRIRYNTTIPEADLVHVIDPAYGQVVHHLERIGVPTISTITDMAFWVQRSLANHMVRRHILDGLRKAQKRIAISNKTADEMRLTANLSCDAVIPIGTDVELFFEGIGARDRFTLLHVGSCIERKGIDRILRLMSALPEEYRFKQVGGRFDQNQQNLIKRFGLQDRVEQIPHAPARALAEYIRKSGLLLFPSHYEGFGVPVIEARLTGTQVLSSDQAPAVDLLNEDRGIHVDDWQLFDEDAFVNFGLDPLRNQFAARVQALSGDAVPLHERERFSWDTVAATVLDVYREVIEIPDSSVTRTAS